MKKISMLSLIAVLAATPMMAEAARSIQKTDNLTITANTNVASTSYVQGAYNAANTKINALIDDTAVAAKADGDPDYVAVSANSTVGENLAALDDKIAELGSDTAANLTSAINELDATVSYAASGINIQVTEADGVLTGVTANIIDAAVTTGKIANDAVTTAKIEDDAVTSDKIAESAVTTTEIADGTIVMADMSNSAISTNIAGSDTASDDKFTTEKAVRTAIDAINGDATALTGRVTAAESAIDVLNGDATQSGSVAKAAADTLSAAKSYVDATTLTVFTTWDSNASSDITLNTAQNAE